MVLISEAKDAFDIGAVILAYLKTRKVDKHTSAIIDSLRRIYFERSTLELIKGISTATEADRDDLVRRLEQKLLTGRYEVHQSLQVLTDEGLDARLSLKQRRLIALIRMGKGQIRSKIFHSIREATENNRINIVSELLEEIDNLNTAIEEVEEKFEQSRKST